jgi:hypothetical protein
VYTVIEPAERAVLEEKLRSTLGSGAATTALLKLLDAVNDNLAPYTEVVPIADLEEALPVVLNPEVQVTESSP